MQTKTIFLWMSILCLGAAAGFLAGRGRAPGPEQARAPKRAVVPVDSVRDEGAVRELEAEVARLEAENRRLNDRNRTLTAEAGKRQGDHAQSPAPPPVAIPVVSPTTGAVTWARYFNHAINISKGLTEDAAKALGLSDSRRDVVNDAIFKAAEAVATLELANATVKYAADDELIITVKAFPEEGEEVRNDLIARLRDALGDDAYAEFDATIGNNLPSLFSGFGGASRDITIKAEQPAEGGSTMYRISDCSNTGPSGSGGSGFSMISSGGSAGGSSMTGMSIESSGGGMRVSRTRQLVTPEIPPEYAHFLGK